MIRHDNCTRTCIKCLLCTCHSHNPLYNKRNSSCVNNLTKLLYCLTSCRRIQILKKWKTDCINIHRNHLSTCLLYHIHLFTNRLNIPWLHCWNSLSMILLDRCRCPFKYIRIRTISRKCCNSICRTGRY